MEEILSKINDLMIDFNKISCFTQTIDDFTKKNQDLLRAMTPEQCVVDVYDNIIYQLKCILLMSQNNMKSVKIVIEINKNLSNENIMEKCHELDWFCSKIRAAIFAFNVGCGVIIAQKHIQTCKVRALNRNVRKMAKQGQKIWFVAENCNNKIHDLLQTVYEVLHI